MTHLTTSPDRAFGPRLNIGSLVSALCVALLSALAMAQSAPRDATPPTSADAVTALHLQTLGKWH